MLINSSKQLRIIFTLVLFALSCSAQAIVIRHDKADSKYRVDENHYPQVFFLHSRFGNKVCVATMISDQWAITAGHCTDQTPIRETLARSETFPLLIDGKARQVVEIAIHPDYQHDDQSKAVDLALIKLDKKMDGFKPVRLYLETDELDQVVSFVGWGYTGIGTQGRQANDGKLRRAQNTVSKAGQWLQFHFDDPRIKAENALSLEGVPGLGDSGGPALLENEDGFLILGVAIGEVEDAANPNAEQGLYGATELYERISSHLAWINSVVVKKSSF